MVKKSPPRRHSDALKAVGAHRQASVRVKKTRKLTESSKRWLQRQLNDPYVAAAQAAGYRSRAAYKLLQLDEKFKLLRKGLKVLDLGAAPGGWSQVAAQTIGPKGQIVGIDLLPIDPMEGASFIQLDFMDESAPATLTTMLGGKADLVLSDMAPSTTGHAATDHIRIMALAEAAADFAQHITAPGGAFVCKLFQGGAEKELLDMLKKNYEKVKHAKPAASRADSSESYIVALGFRA